MATDDIQDVGKGTDKPKGFVRWALIAFWTAIVGLCTYIAKITITHANDIRECNVNTMEVMKQQQVTIDAIRVEYNNKLEQRINRLENVEERVDKALPNQKNIK